MTKKTIEPIRLTQAQQKMLNAYTGIKPDEIIRRFCTVQRNGNRAFNSMMNLFKMAANKKDKYTISEYMYKNIRGFIKNLNYYPYINEIDDTKNIMYFNNGSEIHIDHDEEPENNVLKGTNFYKVTFLHTNGKQYHIESRK